MGQTTLSQIDLNQCNGVAVFASFVMLRVFSRNAKKCYERARCAAQVATNARTPDERRLYLDEEKRWLILAASYDYQEILKAFIEKLRSRFRRQTDAVH
jgi:hypothetical protein